MDLQAKDVTEPHYSVTLPPEVLQGQCAKGRCKSREGKFLSRDLP